MSDVEEGRTSRRLTAVEEAIWGRYHGKHRDVGLLNTVNYLARRVDALESAAPVPVEESGTVTVTLPDVKCARTVERYLSRRRNLVAAEEILLHELRAALPEEEEAPVPVEEREAECDRCGAPKGRQAIGEGCNTNCGGRVVPVEAPAKVLHERCAYDESVAQDREKMRRLGVPVEEPETGLISEAELRKLKNASPARQVWRGGLPSLDLEGLAKLDADIRRLVSKKADLEVYVAGRLLGLQQARELLVKGDGK